MHGAEFDRAAGGWSAQHQQQLREIWAFRDTLPAEHRGTHEAFLLRVRQRTGAGGVVAVDGDKAGVVMEHMGRGRQQTDTTPTTVPHRVDWSSCRN